jgi:hypothetical protein
MKKIVLSIGMLIAVLYSYSQTGTYLVSFKHVACGSINTYSAIITDPTGNTTVQVLPDGINDDINYATQVNQILSNITTQGYHLVSDHLFHPSGVVASNGCVVSHWQYLFAPCCTP